MHLPPWLRAWLGDGVSPPPELLEARKAEAIQMQAAQSLAARARATADQLRYEGQIRRAYQGE